MGFIIGSTAGCCVGLLAGGFTVLKYGPSAGKTYMGTIATQMIGSGGMLGTILGIGSLMRGEGMEMYPSLRSVEVVSKRMDVR